MSASDSHAMRNKRSTLLAATCCVLAVLPLPAAEPAADDIKLVAPPANQREYQPQPLPDDTFLPSEEVSEDYPVPFPVDI